MRRYGVSMDALSRIKCRRCVTGPALFVLLAAGCLLALVQPRAAETASIRLAGVTYLGDLPTLVADRAGLFADHGLDVRVRYGDSGRGNLRALRAGEIDFATMALTPLVLDHLADDDPGGPDDPVILAGMVHSRALNGLVTRADGGVEDADDLAGRRVGVPSGTNTAFAWGLYTDFHGRAPDYADLVNADPDALVDALVAGDVAAALLWEPWIARAEQRLDVPLRRLAEGDLYTADWVLVARRETVAAQTERVRDLLRAYNNAIDRIVDEPEAAIGYYADHAGLDQGRAPSGWSPYDYHLSLDWSLIAGLQHQIAWAQRTGRAEPGRETDVLSLFADEPMRDVGQPVVGIPRSAGQPP